MKKELFNKEGILDIIQEGVGEAIKRRITDNWKSPLDSIIDEVVAENKEQIKETVRDVFKQTIGVKEFSKTLKDEMMHKVAKTLISKLEGGLEKAINDVRQDPTTRARLVVAINELIDNAIKD